VPFGLRRHRIGGDTASRASCVAVDLDATAARGDGRSRACLRDPPRRREKSVVTRDVEVEISSRGERPGLRPTTESESWKCGPCDCSDDGRRVSGAVRHLDLRPRGGRAGPQVCRLGVVKEPTRRYGCNATRTACESIVPTRCPGLPGRLRARDSLRRPGRCRGDTSTVAGKALAALSPDLYDLCPPAPSGCARGRHLHRDERGRRHGFSVADVPSGTYRCSGCAASYRVAGHGPWDSVAGLAALTAPATGPIDVLLAEGPSQE